MNLRFAFVAVLSALSLAACAANTSDPTTDPAGDPATDPAAVAESSDDLTASKCKGMLPQMCQVCGDGSTACAHWVVKNKKCAVETCPVKTCVQNVICATSAHFDQKTCGCVVNTCVQHVMCTTTSHFDAVACKCVAN
jgi:hypothetical protein